MCSDKSVTHVPSCSLERAIGYARNLHLPRSSHVTIAALSVAWVLSGCQECQEDGDCGSSETCKFGECRFACSNDAQCGPGAICSSITRDCQVCSPGLFQCPCTSGGHCSGVLQCVDGICLYGSSTNICGDGTCSRGETCPADCGYSPPGPDDDQNDDYQACVSHKWIGATPCLPLTPTAAEVVDQLYNLWRTSPAYLCRYAPEYPASTLCGPLPAWNAIYCPLDHGISYDAQLLSSVSNQYGYLAAAVFLAHEWGHLNQAELGLASGGSNKALELHADCQAGIFLAAEAAAGRVSGAEVMPTYYAICTTGDPNLSPWFQPGAHGTCPERVQAFQQGFVGAMNFGADLWCSEDPLTVAKAVCG
jgi:hypothetical protein